MHVKGLDALDPEGHHCRHAVTPLTSAHRQPIEMYVLMFP